MACNSSFPSCREENDPTPKSGLDLNLDKPVCATSYQGYVTDPQFSSIFL